VLTGGGAKIPEPTASDPVLNNQIKFWGAIWFGYGTSLWWASADLVGRAELFQILMGTFCSAVSAGHFLSINTVGDQPCLQGPWCWK